MRVNTGLKERQKNKFLPLPQLSLMLMQQVEAKERLMPEKNYSNSSQRYFPSWIAFCQNPVKK